MARNSRTMRNLNSAADSAIRTGSKAIVGTAKWMVTDHTNATQTANIVMSYCSDNCRRANQAYTLRRSKIIGKASLAADVLKWVWDTFWAIVLPIVIALLVTAIVSVSGVALFFFLFWLLFGL